MGDGLLGLQVRDTRGGGPGIGNDLVGQIASVSQRLLTIGLGLGELNFDLLRVGQGIGNLLLPLLQHVEDGLVRKLPQNK